MSEQKKNTNSSNSKDVVTSLIISINTVKTSPKVAHKGTDAMRISENLNTEENKPKQKRITVVVT